MKNMILKSILGLLMVICSLSFTNPYTPTEAPASSVDFPKVNTCASENSVFQDGEEITYKLFYNWKFVWVAAGEVTFKVQDLGNEYYFSAYGRTYKSYDPFFKVRDSYECYVDKETLLPTKSIRKVAEGKYRLFDEVTFDRNRNVAKSFRGKSEETAKVTEYPIEGCIHDILSVIYFSRNIEFEGMDSGDKIPVNLFMDKETWPLNVTYKGRQEKKRIKGNGKFKTMLFSPEVISGEYFREGTEMNVYVSDDDNRIPLIIESPLSVGSVKAVVKRYKGLKYEMTADL